MSASDDYPAIVECIQCPAWESDPMIEEGQRALDEIDRLRGVMQFFELLQAAKVKARKRR